MSLPNPNNEGTWTESTSEGYNYVDIPRVSLRIVDISNYVHTNIFNSVSIPVGTNDGVTARNDQRLSWIRNIIVHFSGGAVGRQNSPPIRGIPRKVIQVCNTIRSRGMGAMAYHYIIPYWENTDQVTQKKIIYKVQDLKVMGSHTALQRRSSIGINCPGGFRGYGSSNGIVDSSGNGAVPSDFQLSSLKELIEYLQKYFSIPNQHIQGHFQHGKITCPGYDIERWLIDLEDQDRKFSYPINNSSSTGTPVLSIGRSDVNAINYLNNTNQLQHGFYPFGRHGLWHNGIHLKSPDNSSSKVYCVHDGWVIASRMVGNVEINGHNYGSPCFILIQHCDPGILRLGNRDRRTQWNPQAPRVERQRMRHINYYSLYMHLKPANDLPETPDWIRMLSDRDSNLHQSVLNVNEPFAFGNISIPVKAGEVIGYTGQHNPFAFDSRISSEYNQLKYLLHFEMFSTINLLAQFDPDASKFSSWTYVHPNINPSEDIRNILFENISGLTSKQREIETAIREADTNDPGHVNPSMVPQADVDLNNLFSKCIVSHVSEWFSDWTNTINQLQLSQELSEEIRQFHNEFQWLRKIWNTQDKRRKLLESTNWLYEWRRPQSRSQAVQGIGTGSAGWSSDHKFFYYHPIRLLNWLNCLRRTVLPDGIDYKRSPGYSVTTLANHDIVGNNRNYDWVFNAGLDWESDFTISA